MQLTCFRCGTPSNVGLCSSCRLQDTIRDENAKNRSHQSELQREQLDTQQRLQQLQEYKQYQQLRQQENLVANGWRIEAESKFQQAQKLFEQDLLNEAVYLYQQVLLQDPSYLPAMLEIAICDLIQPAGVPRAEMAEKLLKFLQLPEWEFKEDLLIRSLLYAATFLPEETFTPMALTCLAGPFKILSDYTYARRGLPPITEQSVLEVGLVNRLMEDHQHPRIQWRNGRSLRNIPQVWATAFGHCKQVPEFSSGITPMAKVLHASFETHREIILADVDKYAEEMAPQGWQEASVWMWQWGITAMGTLPWALFWFQTSYLPDWAKIAWVGWGGSAFASFLTFGAIAKALAGRHASRVKYINTYQAEVDKINEARLSLIFDSALWPTQLDNI